MFDPFVALALSLSLFSVGFTLGRVFQAWSDMRLHNGVGDDE